MFGFLENPRVGVAETLFPPAERRVTVVLSTAGHKAYGEKFSTRYLLASRDEVTGREREVLPLGNGGSFSSAAVVGRWGG